ncbi:MAG TPA: hypothetical protein VI643_08300 [Planctomycetota bacterium]|nr:hypothetical protein [Planctomycetota bacterium]
MRNAIGRRAFAPALCCAGLFVLLQVPALPGQDSKPSTGIINGTSTGKLKVPWAAFVPPGYESSKASVPLLFKVHGMGGKGTDDISSAKKYGPKHNMIVVQPTYTGLPMGRDWPSDPQCLQSVNEIIGDFIAKYRIDTDNIFISGWSGGGLFMHNYMSTFKQPPAGGKPFRIKAILGTSANFFRKTGLAGQVHYFYTAGEKEEPHASGNYMVTQAVDAWRPHQLANKNREWTGRLHMIPNMGHTFPDEVRDLMAEFIDEVMGLGVPEFGPDESFAYQKSSAAMLKDLKDGKTGAVLAKANREQANKAEGKKFDADLVHVAETVGKQAEARWAGLQAIPEEERHRRIIELDAFAARMKGCVLESEAAKLKKKWLESKVVRENLKAWTGLQSGYDLLADGKKTEAADAFTAYAKQCPGDPKKKYIEMLAQWCAKR